MVDKRRHKRVPVALDVLINGTIHARGTNISLGGLYVHTGRNFAVDSLVTVEFRVLDRDVKASAYVKNCQPSIGMGLSFAGLTYDQTHAMKQFVDKSALAQTPQEKKRVLLVDDSEAQRRINKSKLVLDGFTVFEAGGGVEALRVLSESAPDIVVLDLQMADMDGFKVLAYMRGDDRFKSMPALVLSARGTPSDIERAKSAGADAFLVKMMTSPVKLCEHV